MKRKEVNSKSANMEPRCVWFAICCLLQIQVNVSAIKAATTRSIKISRDHVSIWFMPPLQKEFQYEKENLEEMISLVGETFGSLLIDCAPQLPEGIHPDILNNSIVLIPVLVAKYNEKQNYTKLKVMMSFEMTDTEDPNLDSSLGQGQARMRSSLEVAKLIADMANSIHPGTVDTLLVNEIKFLHLIIDEKNDKYIDRDAGMKKLYKINKVVHSAREMLEVGPNGYKLGVILSPQNFQLGKYRQRRYNLVLSSILENVDLIIPVGGYNDFYHSQEGEQIVVTYIMDDIEKQVQELEDEPVEVVPFISCLAPINHDYVGISNFIHCWQFISGVSQENNRSVIMYEAFDQYGDDMPNNLGWWRLKSGNPLQNNQNTLQKVNSSSFIAKKDDLLQDSLFHERGDVKRNTTRKRKGRGGHCITLFFGCLMVIGIVSMLIIHLYRRSGSRQGEGRSEGVELGPM